MLTERQHLVVTLMIAAAVALAACTPERPDPARAERTAEAAETVVLAVEGMT